MTLILFCDDIENGKTLVRIGGSSAVELVPSDVQLEKIWFNSPFQNVSSAFGTNVLDIETKTSEAGAITESTITVPDDEYTLGQLLAKIETLDAAIQITQNLTNSSSKLTISSTYTYLRFKTTKLAYMLGLTDKTNSSTWFTGAANILSDPYDVRFSAIYPALYLYCPESDTPSVVQYGSVAVPGNGIFAHIRLDESYGYSVDNLIAKATISLPIQSVIDTLTVKFLLFDRYENICTNINVIMKNVSMQFNVIDCYV